MEPLKPFISSGEAQREFTLRAVVLGLLLAVVFGAANAYVGLKVGLTVSASIPSAVISMAVLRGLLRRGTILENNIVQALGSSGESLAAGVIFTLPAFLFAQLEFSHLDVILIACAGGLLGILFMIPLRNALMVREHDVLPFPEGTACAKVLIAGEESGPKAWPVWIGLAVGGVVRFAMGGLHLVRDSVSATATSLHKATLSIEVAPMLAAVGYLIGPKLAATLFAGGFFGWVVLIPLFDWLGAQAPWVIEPAKLPVAQLDATGIWKSYVRYMGAGGVAFGGAIALLRALPAMGRSLSGSFQALRLLRQNAGAADARGPRHEQDLPLHLVLGGAILIAVAMATLPVFRLGPLAGVLVVLFAFFFTVVSARMVGMIGTTSQPVSGMTITALLAVGGILAATGHSGPAGLAATLAAASSVCIAICLAGDISQDLKTATLVGATPRKVQLAELLVVPFAAAAAGVVLVLLDRAYGLGSARLPAPQASLISELARGVMGGKLPLVLLLLGAGMGLALEFAGVSALLFSIGLYLPVAMSSAILVGGLCAAMVARHNRGAREEETGAGTLYASGLIAGDALIGILLAATAVIALAPTPGSSTTEPSSRTLADFIAIHAPGDGAGEKLLCLAIFALVCFSLVRIATRRQRAAAGRQTS